ncbi:MAG: TRAP transporter substrate-binding protein DctP [Bacillota bacterium]|nr:TRAP transporter substrate-binding protein DctP [Bacillota bacterium]
MLNNRGRFPLLESFELPGVIYNNSKVASKVAWEGIQLLNPREVQDSKLMMVFATGPCHLFTIRPVRNLFDLKGMEIRGTGLNARILKSLGAVPISMPQSDTYEALLSGVVKGNLSPPEVLKEWNQGELVEYLTYTPFLYNTLFFFNINLDIWNSFSPELQEIIMEVNEKIFEEVVMDLWDKQNEIALQWAIEKNEIEIISLSDEELNKWIEQVKPIQEDFIQEMKSKNLPGQEALQVINELSNKYNQQYK